MRHQRKRNADPTPKNKKTAHPTDQSGPNPTKAALQAHQETHQAKAVANGLAQGAGALPPALLGPTSL
jgi:hypothetical protein